MNQPYQAVSVKKATASILAAAVLLAAPGLLPYGESKLDGKQSIIIDYSETAIYPLSLVRDEIRMVAPSLYLGYAFMRAGGRYVNAIHFALDFV